MTGRTSEILQCITHMLQEAEKAHLLEEVILIALDIAQKNPELQIQDICEIALQEWDI